MYTMKVLKNVQLYEPEYLGKKDILFAGGKIIAIEDEISIDLPYCETYDCQGLMATPGFIDGHVHIIGGGGEGGPKTRTPELMLSKALEAGVTTLVGVLGTDGTTRQMPSLLAKAQALEEEGLTTFIYTGSYQMPTTTITGSVRDDIILIDKVIGVGEVAISDHRSSQPSYQEIKHLAAETRVGGMLSGKAGLVHFHVGSEKPGIQYIFDILDETDIPAHQFLPTHMGRTPQLLDQGLELIKRGGQIDITAGKRTAKQIADLLDRGADIKGITISSDGNGSLPKFDEHGNFIGLGVGNMKTVFNVFRDLVQIHNLELPDALRIVSSNVADNLLINDYKGYLRVGYDADILLLNANLNMDMLFGKGRLLCSAGQPVVKGTFE